VKVKKSQRGAAVWQYMLDTLDPVVHNTLIGTDNPYYLVCTLGHYTPRCHPAYLSPKAHGKLSRPDAFDGLRIHTDEIEEVVRRLKPGSLTVAVIMDSMDWFDPADRGAGGAVKRQITALIRALEMGGRVLLRSAGLTPWYIKEFEGLGFSAKRVGVRTGGACIDR
jgi:betaine lipid synthase